MLLATHCPATVAVLEEGEVFQISRDRGHVRIQPVTRSEAVEELSDGIATLDTGLRIATTDERPVTIVTEGKNALILRRRAALHFPDDVAVPTVCHTARAPTIFGPMPGSCPCGGL